jgi:hypothetical protein
MVANNHVVTAPRPATLMLEQLGSQNHSSDRVPVAQVPCSFEPVPPVTPVTATAAAAAPAAADATAAIAIAACLDPAKSKIEN